MKKHQRKNQFLQGFTLIEVMTVLLIIGILMGIGLWGYENATRRGNQTRAAAEIAAVTSALEKFESDNYFYPPATFIKTEIINSGEEEEMQYDPDAKNEDYKYAARLLFLAITGRTTFDYIKGNQVEEAESYIALIATQVGEKKIKGMSLNNTARSTYEDEPVLKLAKKFAQGSFIRDPFDNPYGYFYDPQSEETSVHTPGTYDMWSTAGEVTGEPHMRERWVSSWSMQ